MRVPNIVNGQFTSNDRMWRTRIKGIILVEENSQGWGRKDIGGYREYLEDKSKMWAGLYRTFRWHLFKNILTILYFSVHTIFFILVWTI